MFKKALQIAVSFSLLVGGYAGYTRLFAVATSWLGEGRVGDLTPFPEIDSQTTLRGNQLARDVFGAGHWAGAKDLKLQYYDSTRGFHMFAQNYQRLNDGKRLRVWPFALISASKDGASHKSATSDEAIIDLSQPFGSLKSQPGAEPSHVVHAKLVGDVRLRDDKGTLDDLTDDLVVSIPSQIEYDEPTLQITTESDIMLEDPGLKQAGVSMMIQLRRKKPTANPGASAPVAGSGPGFEAESLHIYKEVHTTVKNVTSNGILPDKERPAKAEKTPLDVFADGEMEITLPKPRPPVLVGPPDLERPADPTLVKYRRNVRVFRGMSRTDQLTCDTLTLTLQPGPKPKDPSGGTPVEATSATLAGSPSKPAQAGPMSNLTLVKALAQGHDVWLQSEVQGLLVRCVELVYEKHEAEGAPDITYLNGGTRKNLWVEKVDYQKSAGANPTIKSILELTSVDATIFDYGAAGTSKVIARGPGSTRERPARNASVVRTAYWEDEMEMLTWKDGESVMPTPKEVTARSLGSAPKKIAKGTLRRLITLTGPSKLEDVKSSTTLDAQRAIVAEFQEAPRPEKPPALAPGASPPTSTASADGSTQIKWLDAYQDAHLVAPSRILTARTFLKAEFEASTPLAPVVAFAPPATLPPVAPETKPEPPPAKVEPLVDGRADRVWASILLGSKGVNGELKNARLRGGVMVHQDPEPGKKLGADASGEALDITSQGNGQMHFAIQAAEAPQASDSKTKLASDIKGRAPRRVTLAKVEFQGKSIESEDILFLDQKLNVTWSRGNGRFTQLADRGLLDDKGIEGDKARATAKPRPKEQLVITWTESMTFLGKSQDLEGRPAAKIEFRGTTRDVQSVDGRREFRRGVVAQMPESTILCDSMDVYLDQTVVLNKEVGGPKSKSDEPGSADPQISMIDCKGKNIAANGSVKVPGVDIINEKFLEGGEIKERQRLRGIHIAYDKRTGAFEAPGPGTSWLYKRKGGDAKNVPKVGTTAPAAKGGLPPLELTKIKYSEGMRGRFGVGKDLVDTQDREAQFVGNVEAANAVVDTKNSDIDFDRPRRGDYVFLSSDDLHVFSEPPPINSKAPARQLLNARGNAAAQNLNERNECSIILADLITYDSSNELIYAYGQDGKEVSVTKSDSPGQPGLKTSGNSLRYNKKTHESEFKDPSAISFADKATGIRTKPFFPDIGGSPNAPTPIKPQRIPFQKVPRQSTERKSFTGGL